MLTDCINSGRVVLDLVHQCTKPSKLLTIHLTTSFRKFLTAAFRCSYLGLLVTTESGESSLCWNTHAHVYTDYSFWLTVLFQCGSHMAAVHSQPPRFQNPLYCAIISKGLDGYSCFFNYHTSYNMYNPIILHNN